MNWPTFRESVEETFWCAAYSWGKVDIVEYIRTGILLSFKVHKNDYISSQKTDLDYFFLCHRVGWKSRSQKVRIPFLFLVSLLVSK